ncbi:MAG TPA: ABC transporter permease [Kofleriaceae bacterium]|nr:ABC transporter permease [Kofleriaceae bacterium]
MSPGLRNALVIARREFTERARSRWFLAMTLLGPIGIVALIVVPSLLTANPAGTRVEIVDRTGVLAEPLVAALTVAQWKPAIIAPATPDADEMARIRDRKINGFLTVPADALDGGTIVYRGDNGSNQIVSATLHEVVRLVVQAERGKRAGIAGDKLAQVIQPAAFEAQQTNGKAEATAGIASFLIGYALAYVLFLVTTIYAVAVMRSVVQEKTSRVMELMVATVKPRSLMAGKIVGVGGAGLVQVAVWLVMAALVITYRDQVLGAFGISGAAVTLPSLTFDVIAIALGFFVLGYFFYASMYAAVGAMVSTEQDTQQVQTPVTLLLLVGLVSVTSVSGDPRGVTATVMTLIPFWSPLLMPMRYVLGGATPVDIVISLAILLVSTVLIARAAAKIYRVGVLMYGKRPGVQELIRWLRY